MTETHSGKYLDSRARQESPAGGTPACPNKPARRRGKRKRLCVLLQPTFDDFGAHRVELLRCGRPARLVRRPGHLILITLQAHRNEDIRCKGLKNVGHTCYINCIVQYIVNSPVTAFFLTGLVPEDPADVAKEPNHPFQASAQNRRDLIRQLVRHLSTWPTWELFGSKLSFVRFVWNQMKCLHSAVAQLWRHAQTATILIVQDAVVHALYREERPISPTNLVAALWKVADVPSYTMEDAHVCWLAFANSLDAIILDPQDRSKCRFEGLDGAIEGRDITLARYLFGLTVWSTVTCSHCAHRSQTSETCFDLQVALPEPGSEQSPSMTAEPPSNKRTDEDELVPPTPQLPSVAEGLSPRYTPMYDIDSSSSVGTEGLLKGSSRAASLGKPALAPQTGHSPAAASPLSTSMTGCPHSQVDRCSPVRTRVQTFLVPRRRKMQT